MAVNLITTAKIAPTRTSAKKADPSVIEVAGMEAVAALDHTIKWLTAVVNTVKSELYSKTIGPKFVALGTAAEKKPDSFIGEDGLGQGTIQIKKRASNSEFTDTELEMVYKYNVPTDTSGGLLYVNPVHMDWLLKNSAKISKAIAKLPDAPEDLFLKQPTKIVSADDSLDFVCKTYKDKPEVVAKLLPVVGTFSISPKFGTGAIDDESTNAKALDTILTFLADNTDD